MKTVGTIFDLKRFTIHDGPGIRTTVFFKGCPLDCWWCHNPESRRSGVESVSVGPGKEGTPHKDHKTPLGREVISEEVFEQVARDILFYDNSGGGVTFSGGEPMFQIDFLGELLRRCRDEGIHTAVDTCGHAPSDDFRRILPFADLFLFDLKLINDGEHIVYTGVSNREILCNLKMLSESGGNIIIRIPMIPGITDTWENLKGIAEFLESIKSIRRISLLPYNKLGEDKRERYQMPGRLSPLDTQSNSELLERSDYLQSKGYEVQIGG
ncbi:Glycyl-radical enzyme activating protein family [Candidatus Zixiibacteriota bacterium]|nr:Glycyl-radical enzyme activating protein family [candidate division Zixibacteria bacterium]